MGSLLSGWDAPCGKPKEFDDYIDEDEQAKRGYFATYSMRKSANKQQALDQSQATPAAAGTDGRTGVANLRRSSMPTMQSMRSPPRRVPSGDLGLKAPLLGHEARHFEHSVTMPAAGTRRVVSETGYMDPLGLSDHPASSLDAYKMGHAHQGQDQTQPQWWKKLSSGALNVMALEEDTPAHGAKSAPFRPQYDVTGQGLGAFRMGASHATASTEVSDAPPSGDATQNSPAGQ